MFLSDEQSRKKVSFFTALCMLCSMAEMLIPKPSFIRIGFSNIPVMLALSYGFTVKEYIALVILRIVCQALLNGTVFSYAFVMSVSAGITSAAVMFFAYGLTGISYVGLSEIGAFFSNLVQLYVAHFFLGSGVYYLAPAVLGIGAVTSFILGVMTPEIRDILKVDEKYRAFCFEEVADSGLIVEKKIDVLKLIIGTALMFVTFFTDSLSLNFGICICFLICCMYSGKKINLLMSLMVLFQAVILALIIPLGKVLFSIWILPVTEGALKLGLRRAFILLSGVYFSRFVIPSKSELNVNNNSVLYMVLFFFRKLSEPECIENN